MHIEAFRYVQDVVRRAPPRKRVIEFGGRNFNGSIRRLFVDAQYYVSIDLVDGKDVDVVGDALTYETEAHVDTVICCEVLEHSPAWSALMQKAYELLAKDGWLITTCATDPRAPHSQADGRPLDRPDSWMEYYGNVDPQALRTCVEQLGFQVDDLQVARDRGDLYLTAVKP